MVSFGTSNVPIIPRPKRDLALDNPFRSSKQIFSVRCLVFRRTERTYNNMNTWPLVQLLVLTPEHPSPKLLTLQPKACHPQTPHNFTRAHNLSGGRPRPVAPWLSTTSTPEAHNTMIWHVVTRSPATYIVPPK